MLDFFQLFYSYFWVFAPILAIEFVIIKFSRIDENKLRTLIASLFLISLVITGIMVLIGASLVNGLSFLLFEQPDIAVIFLYSLFAALILFGFKKFSIEKRLSLKNTLITLGVAQFVLLFFMSLQKWHLNISWLTSWPEGSVIVIIPHVVVPFVSVTLGILLYVLPMSR